MDEVILGINQCSQRYELIPNMLTTFQIRGGAWKTKSSLHMITRLAYAFCPCSFWKNWNMKWWEKWFVLQVAILYDWLVNTYSLTSSERMSVLAMFCAKKLNQKQYTNTILLFITTFWQITREGKDRILPFIWSEMKFRSLCSISHLLTGHN